MQQVDSLPRSHMKDGRASIQLIEYIVNIWMWITMRIFRSWHRKLRRRRYKLMYWSIMLLFVKLELMELLCLIQLGPNNVYRLIFYHRYKLLKLYYPICRMRLRWWVYLLSSEPSSTNQSIPRRNSLIKTSLKRILYQQLKIL